MKRNRIFAFLSKTVLLAASALLISSCARNISSDSYTAGSVGQASVTYSGIIKNVRQVCVEGGDQLEDNGLGIIGGGVAGGLLGSCIGSGNGRILPTAVGAIAGAVGGSMIEKKARQQCAFEYIVELDNGQLMTIVQGQDTYLGIGQPVYIIMSYSGRSRIAPAYP